MDDEYFNDMHGHLFLPSMIIPLSHEALKNRNSKH
jgi:hypothetical protein